MKQYKSLNDVLNRMMRQLGIEDQVLENGAIGYWAEVAGPKIAQNTKAERVIDGVLFVKVKNDVWRNELLFFKDELIKKINSRLGKSLIHDIKLK
jgi:predicted nucleic acid-binding Zn ribbon protein